MTRRAGAPGPPTVIALTPGTLVERDFASFALTLARCADAGLRALLVREPALSDAAYLALANLLRPHVARERGGWFGVHDRAHLALELDADAVHVGQRSLTPRELRAWLPAGIALGLSTHAHDDAERWRDADYLFHGPVFATRSKAHALAPIGPDGLASAVSRAQRPVWALGGVEPEHARALRGAGAHGVAVMGGLWSHAEPAERVRSYLAAWPIRA